MNAPNEKKRKISRYLYMQILGVIIAVIIFIVMVGVHSKEAKVVVEGQNVKIEGSYGEAFLLNDISQVNLVDTLPAIKMRSNGYSLGSVKKGYFKTKSGETIKLFLHSSHGPYLHIQRKSDMPVFINYEDSTQIQQVFNDLFMLTNN